MSVSPAEATSAVDSGLSVGTKVSLHSGSFIDEGASREELSSMTSVCLGWASSRYSSFGGGTDCSSCWSCARLSFCKLSSLGTELYKSPHVNARCALVYIPSLVGRAYVWAAVL